MRGRPHRIVRQEPPDHRVVVAGLHVDEACGSVLDMACIARLVVIRRGGDPVLAERLFALAPHNRARGARARDRAAEMIRVQPGHRRPCHPRQSHAGRADVFRGARADLVDGDQPARYVVDGVTRHPADDLFRPAQVPVIGIGAGDRRGGRARCIRMRGQSVRRVVAQRHRARAHLPLQQVADRIIAERAVAQRSYLLRMPNLRRQVVCHREDAGKLRPFTGRLGPTIHSP